MEGLQGGGSPRSGVQGERAKIWQVEKLRQEKFAKKMDKKWNKNPKNDPNELDLIDF